MSAYTFALLLSVATLALMVNLLRTRRMREKYALWWALLAVGVILLALNPRILEWAADVVGIVVPTNLLFFASGFVLLAVCVQFSTELSSLEEDRRVLCEEVAMVRLELRHLTERVARQEASAGAPEPDPHPLPAAGGLVPAAAPPGPPDDLPDGTGPART
ncbi:DUF2304 domain-containing protein [Cellulomonas aerilata]|uniref:DUF2304 domain-containing protein n=1 Tax=Cellulomonas aerilata TaxID=515326 RepID=A0A512DH38_9CELL|nr:DUF2304 domain-containing protein [Cellulomonas aerilata]GEO35798.1 hypothetical protein CAE01nite_35230 [Cellulomonas aerilata]